MVIQRKMTSKCFLEYSLRRLNLCVCQTTLTSSVRFGSSWKRRVLKQEELKNVVFQYVGSNARRAERIYVWGCSTTGALGQYSIVLIISYWLLFVIKGLSNCNNSILTFT